MTTTAQQELTAQVEELWARIQAGGADAEAARAAFDDAIARLEVMQSEARPPAEDRETAAAPTPPHADSEQAPPRHTAAGVLWRVRELTDRLGYSPVGAVQGRSLNNVNVWERVLTSWRLSAADIEGLNQQLDSFQLAATVRERMERADRQRAETRTAPDPMAAVRAEDMAEAERLATYRRSPEGRAERSEELLTEIRDLLRESLQVRRS